eukprot:749319-Pelagomonas_calceolata.AAC.1
MEVYNGYRVRVVEGHCRGHIRWEKSALPHRPSRESNLEDGNERMVLAQACAASGQRVAAEFPHITEVAGRLLLARVMSCARAQRAQGITLVLEKK